MTAEGKPPEHLKSTVIASPRSCQHATRMNTASNSTSEILAALATVSPPRLPRANDPAARALAAASTPARFGPREKTLLDAQVRDTGEIPAARRMDRHGPAALAMTKCGGLAITDVGGHRPTPVIASAAKQPMSRMPPRRERVGFRHCAAWIATGLRPSR